MKTASTYNQVRGTLLFAHARRIARLGCFIFGAMALLFAVGFVPARSFAAEGARPPAFSETVFADSYAARREAAIRHIAAHSGPRTYSELVRIEAGQKPNESAVYRDLADIDARNDCADFDMHAVLRMLYQFGDRPEWSVELLERAKATVLGFKYWPDEPGVDSMCTWSENHHILFASAGYLAGQLYPDAVFSNSGRTGREQMAAHRPRVLRWLDLRFRSGFSEWLSNVYYDADMTALVDLADFCEDSEIAMRAAMVLDLVLADLACNSFRGVFGSTHGRTYEKERKHARSENTTLAQCILFGRGTLDGGGMSGPSLLLSKRYRMPRILFEIANRLHERDSILRQRMGIRIDEAAKWGLGFDCLEDGMVWLSLETYAHPRTINLFGDMLDAFGWWENDFFADFKPFRYWLERGKALGVLPCIARLVEHDSCRNTREEVNIYTYRTPEYMLSTAQDYRRGYGGDQQHIWQATLGPEAVCFTSHPARREGPSPNYWVGYGTLPRTAQIKNVVLEVYNVTRWPNLYVPNELFFTHAWFPREAFDEVIERSGWLFARRGDGYLALWSQHAYEWQQAPGEDQNREIIVEGRENVYICELGYNAMDASFATFVERIANAPVSVEDRRVVYESPSQGRLEFGWYGPLLQEGRPVPLVDYPRYENPYALVDFPAEHATFRLGEHSLDLDWKTATRNVSAFIE